MRTWLIEKRIARIVTGASTANTKTVILTSKTTVFMLRVIVSVIAKSQVARWLKNTRGKRERSESMDIIRRIGVFFITLLVYFVASLFISALIIQDDYNSAILGAWIIGGLVYGITMTFK